MNLIHTTDESLHLMTLKTRTFLNYGPNFTWDNMDFDPGCHPITSSLEGEAAPPTLENAALVAASLSQCCINMYWTNAPLVDVIRCDSTQLVLQSQTGGLTGPPNVPVRHCAMS